MSEDRYDKLLNAAIVLLIASATVLGYSVYKSHFKNTSTNTATASELLINNLRDSLKNVYANTVKSIDTNLVRTNTENNPELQERYKEIESLNAEISRLLLSNGADATANAQQKIQELQQKVETLEIRYEDAESQNRKLQNYIKQLTATRNAQQNNTSKNTGTAPLSDQEIKTQATTQIGRAHV